MGEVYAGLDVSDKATQVCVVDGSGRLVWSGAWRTPRSLVLRRRSGCHG